MNQAVIDLRNYVKKMQDSVYQEAIKKRTYGQAIRYVKAQMYDTPKSYTATTDEQIETLVNFAMSDVILRLQKESDQALIVRNDK